MAKRTLRPLSRSERAGAGGSFVVGVLPLSHRARQRQPPPRRSGDLSGQRSGFGRSAGETRRTSRTGRTREHPFLWTSIPPNKMKGKQGEGTRRPKRSEQGQRADLRSSVLLAAHLRLHARGTNGSGPILPSVTPGGLIPLQTACAYSWARANTERAHRTSISSGDLS